MNAKKAQFFITQNAIYIVLVLLIMGIIMYEPSFMSINTLRDIMIQSSTRDYHRARRCLYPHYSRYGLVGRAGSWFHGRYLRFDAANPRLFTPVLP
jgi:hypothetical protein